MDIVSNDVNERRHLGWQIQFLYETTDGSNILTKDKLLAIKDFEKRVYNLPKYRDLCRTVLYNSTHLKCAPMQTFLNYFDPSFSIAFNGSQVSDPEMKRIPWFLTLLYNNTIIREEIKFMLGTETKINLANNSIETNRIRTVISTGSPAPNAYGEFIDFGMKIVVPFIRNEMKHRLPGVPIKLKFFNNNIYWTEAPKQVTNIN